MNAMTIKALFLFLYALFLTSRLSNAGISISVGLLCIVLIYVYIKRFKKFILPNTTFLILYVIFFCSLLLSAVLSGDSKSIHETIKYLYWTFPFWVVYVSEKQNFSITSWGYGVSLSLFMLSLCAVYQWISFPLGTRISGTFTSPNGFAGVLETSLPMAVALYWAYGKENQRYIRYILIGIITLSALVLLATQSRGGIAGAVIGGVVVFLLRYQNRIHLGFSRWKWILGVLIFIGVVGGVSFLGLSTFHRSYDNERMLLIESSYAMWKDHPIYGVGFSNWKEQYQAQYISPMAKEPNLPMPHNNIAFFFSTTGVIGGLGYGIFTVGLLVLLLRKSIKHPDNVYYQAALWSFIAITVHGLVDSGITNKGNMQLLSFCLGIAFASEDNENIIT